MRRDVGAPLKAIGLCLGGVLGLLQGQGCHGQLFSHDANRRRLMAREEDLMEIQMSSETAGREEGVDEELESRQVVTKFQAETRRTSKQARCGFSTIRL